MDEVENPALPQAGQSPTIRPVDESKGEPISAAADEPVDQNSRTSLPARPPLIRESSNPPPPQPPPAPPSQASETGEFPQDPPDSLTLADLKRIRSTFPNAQAQQKVEIIDCNNVYDFEYQDAQSFPAELEEWFSYSDDEETKLRLCKAEFNRVWRESEDGEASDWVDVTEDARRRFVQEQIRALKDDRAEDIQRVLMILTYICLGVWEETAGRQDGLTLQDLFHKCGRGARLNEYGRSSLQIQWIVAMVDTLHACDALKVVYGRLRTVSDRDFTQTRPEHLTRNEVQPNRADESIELWCCLTLLYVFIETARTTQGANGQSLKRDILALEPNLLNYFTQIVARLRWDEHAPIPLTKMLLLSWKTMLIFFGGIKDVEMVKEEVREHEKDFDGRGEPVITASPLDYHLFRQEISSKYPAYQAPPPVFAVEPENNSILPPLKHRRPSHAASVEALQIGASSVGTGSIMHQPVHIATPAPSPPPSPGGPGKAGKKQNYQTNQMFPFLYPPLGIDSNALGGKGSTELQDALVGRRWEGSDVPSSILEAAELFATRMRATRALRQLWEARVDFMKFERGWKGDGDASSRGVEDFEWVDKPVKPEQTAEQGAPEPESEAQRKLRRVNDYYRDSLPYLQSIVIVLLKTVLQNVTDIVTRGNGQNGLQAGISFNEPNGVNGTTEHKPLENGNVENSAEELDKLRTQEIAAKALTAIILLLLKWFKVNHILQYEYLTQLLLDSNYVPLILKLWQTQDIGRACHFPLENQESNFFYFCQINSRQGPAKAQSSGDAGEESDDDAAPPPIRRKRQSAEENPLSPTTSPHTADLTLQPPEVDELGYPQNFHPSTPIKSYSWRNLFASINYLRILQKITRRKTHRSLLLVSYKSSNYLKKALKIPVHLLRFYTLRIFKSQVPFCGRKWRQSNMKIITAVWLSVPAELRDDWLQGGGGGMGGACVGDVDGSVEDALPLEQSLRSLTHWWNVKTFSDVMGVDQGLIEEEQDFFQKELDKMQQLTNPLENGEEVDEGMMDDGMGMGMGPIDGY